VRERRREEKRGKDKKRGPTSTIVVCNRKNKEFDWIEKKSYRSRNSSNCVTTMNE
jgi:hypothetical protein